MHSLMCIRTYACIRLCGCVRVYPCICVCMHLCMYACMHVCMYACMHECMYACMYVCMYACMHECTYAGMHVCMYACMHTCIYACMHACMHAWMHGCMHAYRKAPEDSIRLSRGEGAYRQVLSAGRRLKYLRGARTSGRDAASSTVGTGLGCGQGGERESLTWRLILDLDKSKPDSPSLVKRRSRGGGRMVRGDEQSKIAWFGSAFQVFNLGSKG